jgi:hypothetical protein
MSDVAQVLRKARALYAANPSHASLMSCPTYPAVCVVTATMNAAFEMELGLDEADAADAFLMCMLNLGDAAVSVNPLLVWNAENSTETVLAAFDKAITEADNA